MFIIKYNIFQFIYAQTFAMEISGAIIPSELMKYPSNLLKIFN